MKMMLAENIRTFRKERSLTQEQLAEALGVTAGAVYKWEAKKRLRRGAHATDYHPMKPESVTQPAAGSRSANLLPIPCSRYHRCSIPGPVPLRESRSAPHTA